MLRQRRRAVSRLSQDSKGNGWDLRFALGLINKCPKPNEPLAKSCARLPVCFTHFMLGSNSLLLLSISVPYTLRFTSAISYTTPAESEAMVAEAPINLASTSRKMVAAAPPVPALLTAPSTLLWPCLLLLEEESTSSPSQLCNSHLLPSAISFTLGSADSRRRILEARFQSWVITSWAWHQSTRLWPWVPMLEAAELAVLLEWIQCMHHAHGRQAETTAAIIPIPWVSKQDWSQSK